MFVRGLPLSLLLRPSPCGHYMKCSKHRCKCIPSRNNYQRIRDVLINVHTSPASFAMEKKLEFLSPNRSPMAANSLILPLSKTTILCKTTTGERNNCTRVIIDNKHTTRIE
jgi:predicted metal-binding protein